MARARPAPPPPLPSAWLVCALAWAVPGGGHLWLGRRRTGSILLVVLLVMFGVGLALDGRLFWFDAQEPFGVLMALADLGIGVAYFAAGALGFGAGQVVTATYEHGNTFLIVAGLLNMLVVLDAYDIAERRK